MSNIEEFKLAGDIGMSPYIVKWLREELDSSCDSLIRPPLACPEVARLDLAREVAL